MPDDARAVSRAAVKLGLLKLSVLLRWLDVTGTKNIFDVIGEPLRRSYLPNLVPWSVGYPSAAMW